MCLPRNITNQRAAAAAAAAGCCQPRPAPYLVYLLSRVGPLTLPSPITRSGVCTPSFPLQACVPVSPSMLPPSPCRHTPRLSAPPSPPSPRRVPVPLVTAAPFSLFSSPYWRPTCPASPQRFFGGPRLTCPSPPSPALHPARPSTCPCSTAARPARPAPDFKRRRTPMQTWHWHDEHPGSKRARKAGRHGWRQQRHRSQTDWGCNAACAHPFSHIVHTAFVAVLGAAFGLAPRPATRSPQSSCSPSPAAPSRLLHIACC